MLNERSHPPEHMQQASISNTINTYTTISSTDALLKEADRRSKEEPYGMVLIAATLIESSAERKLNKTKTQRMPSYADYLVCTLKEPSNVPT